MPFNPCSRTSRKLSAYLDGELDAADQAEVKAHLPNCALCSAELVFLSSIDAGLRRMPGAKPVPFFAARVSAAARASNEYRGPFRRFLRLPIPAMAIMVSFILINVFTFAFNINAMENVTRRELARKVVTQLSTPASMLNPVALVRLCGDCSKYMCLCMHEAGKESTCPCKDCEMGKTQKQTQPEKPATMENMGEKDVH